MICLDFDGVDGVLPPEWEAWLQGAAVERSASGKGFHAFFRVPPEFAKKLRGNRDEHTGFSVYAMADATGAAKRIDVFCGGVNRWVKVTGNAVNDWAALRSIELCDVGLEMLEAEFERQGFFQAAGDEEQGCRVKSEGRSAAGSENVEELGHYRCSRGYPIDAAAQRTSG